MMPVIISLLVIVAVAWFILKGYRAEPILLIAGIVLMLSAWLGGYGKILPNGIKSTGSAWLDPFEMIHYLFSSRASNLGLMIMGLMGFAKYMDRIGANQAVVQVVTKPLRHFKSPYILLFIAYLFASLLQLAVPSATGLAVLLMGTMFPIMRSLGLSALSSAGVIATSLGVAYTPTAVDAIRGAEATGMDVVNYVLKYQGPAAIVTVLVVGVVHIFWQRYCDTKAGLLPQNIQTGVDNDTSDVTAPALYAILPLLPIVFAIASSSLITDKIHLDIVTIVFISMAIAMLVEYCRSFDFKQVCMDFNAFLDGMGKAFAGVVGLLVAAGIFAHGIKAIGVIQQLIDVAKHVGLPPFAMAIIFALVTFAAAVIMGSGNAPFLAFVELIPQIANSMGVNAVSMILPMQQASHMGRACSPVSGVMIAVSTGAGDLSPFAVVKRTAVPLSVGFLVHCGIIGIFY